MNQRHVTRFASTSLLISSYSVLSTCTGLLVVACIMSMVPYAATRDDYQNYGPSTRLYHSKLRNPRQRCDHTYGKVHLLCWSANICALEQYGSDHHVYE